MAEKTLNQPEKALKLNFNGVEKNVMSTIATPLLYVDSTKACRDRHIARTDASRL
jgi:hypothetical protein